MKNLFIIILSCLVFATNTQAQTDRSKAPEPGPAPTIQMGSYQTFTTKNGIKVIVVENRKVPVVSFQISLDKDPVLEGDKTGYIELAGDLMRSGTLSRSKAQIDEEIDFIGASLSTFSSGVFGSALKKHQNKLLEIMTDVLMNPTFPEEELEKSRTQQISSLANVPSNANAIASNVSQKLRYGDGHPYSEITTEETLKNIQREDLVNYYNTYFKPNIAYLIIVGDINTREAKKLVKRYFGKWQKGEVPRHIYPKPEQPESNRVALAERKGAVQSVVTVTYPVDLQPGAPDAIKASVMNSILGGGIFSGRLIQNLREDKGWTYGAGSNLSTDRLVGSWRARTEVRNSVTDSTVTEILKEMQMLRESPVNTEDLELTKSFMNGSFARSLESPRVIASYAYNVERYKLPKDYYTTYLEKLSAVSVQDVQEMANKYLKPENAYIVVAGNKDEVMPTLAKFSKTGDVELYDAFGRVIEQSDLPTGLTVTDVLEKYFKALGGKDKASGVEDVKIDLTASIQGQNLRITLMNKAPNMSYNEVSMNGNPVMVQYFDGEKGGISQMGSKMPVSDEMAKDMAFQAAVFPELAFSDYGIDPKLTGVEQIGSKKAYAIEYQLPSGSKSIAYYDVESGLKLRSVTFVNTPQGPVEQSMDFENYKEVDGIKFPYTIVQPMGPMKLQAEVQNISINSGLDKASFSMP
ncbi:MAG: insulinase family protein [Cyclobacteriaceae bacterium]|nr:insulinase family protein [Cyclobacteriaceae bacterium]